MRVTWWMQRRRRIAASAMAVAIAGLGAAAAAGAGSPAAAADRPAQANAAGSQLVKPTQRTGVVPHTVVVVLSGTSVTGKPLRRGSTALAPKTSNAVVNTALSQT